MNRNHERSRALFAEAQKLLPGGVDSPVRSFRSVGLDPVFMASGAGARLTDVDGNEYIDYCGSWGPLILGHAHPRVVEAVSRAAARGLSFGAATELEVELARRVCDMVPSIEMVRFVNSGTEATMSALRVARAFTGRDKILKFDGCYHGHSDGLLAQAGSGLATLSLPDSAGVPAAFAAETLVAPYNDIEAVQDTFARLGDTIAAVIIEPVAANMGVVTPAPGFLEDLRALCDGNNTLLIFDEVITGFRVGLGGYQELCGVRPDLTCLGKIIGGGMPVGAYGGRAEIMQLVAPLGPVYQAGTLSGNPLAMTAGIETLDLLSRPGFYATLESKAARFEAGLTSAALEVGVPVQVRRVASMLTMFFNQAPVRSYDDAKLSNRDSYATFFKTLLDFGVYFPPSQFEAAFVSAAHEDIDIEVSVEAASEALKAVARANP